MESKSPEVSAKVEWIPSLPPFFFAFRKIGSDAKKGGLEHKLSAFPSPPSFPSNFPPRPNEITPRSHFLPFPSQNPLTNSLFSHLPLQHLDGSSGLSPPLLQSM